MPAAPAPRRPLLTCGVVAALAVVALSAGCRRSVSAGLFFEPVAFSASAVGGALTADDLQVIDAVARAELRQAFAGLRIVLSDSRDARFRVAVVQQLTDPALKAQMFVAGESRALRGFGGSGAVNFSLLATNALSCAPADASRQVLLEAIGRGVGRAAAHEFAHVLLRTAPIHDSTDVESYEYASAGRCQQYFGPMHWDIARPWLRARLGD